MEVIQVGEYEFNEKDRVGQGGFGTVYKGRKTQNPSRLVAIKVVNKTGMFANAKLVAKEIKILLELRSLHHPNLITMLDCMEKSSRVYIIMEYCNGGDFADYLRNKGQLSESTIRFFLRQLAKGISTIHSKGIVHRDIKPQNILLVHKVTPPGKPRSSDLTLKIGDFGTSRHIVNDSLANTTIGTPAYMAPEVIIGLKYDFKADLWSLGVTIYQSLTGCFPFNTKSAFELKAMYESNLEFQPKIPAGTSSELNNLLIGLLRLNPSKRMSLDAFHKHLFLQQANNPQQCHLVGPAPVSNGTGLWVCASGGQIPKGGVVAGRYTSGEAVYVARAVHNGSLAPGQLVPSHGCAFITWGGRVQHKHEYQVLVRGSNQWVPASGACVPLNAIRGGFTEGYEPLYVGRVRHAGIVTPGKVQRSHGVCYIPFDGLEKAFSTYEILI